MSFVIEQGVPVPAGRSRYPFADMEVGDSFFVGVDSKETATKRIQSVRAQAGRFAKENGVKFSVRSVVEDEVPGVRCWRVE